MKYTLNRPDVFPPGTELNLFAAEAIPQGEIPPTGPVHGALETIVVGLEGEGEEAEVNPAVTSVEFQNVDEGRNYIVLGVLPGEDEEVRHLRFVPGKMGKSLKPPARFPTHVPG